MITPKKIAVRLRQLFIASLLVFSGALPAAADTYQIPIEVSIPVTGAADTEATKAYNKLVLGVHAGATGNYDPQWDTPAFFTTLNAENPPLLKAAVQHPEYAENRRELWRDIRSDAGGRSQQWDLSITLAPSEIGKTVTLKWVLPPSGALSGKRVTLTDSESDLSVDMRSQSSYRFVHGASLPRTLSVTVNSSSGSSDNGSSGFLGCGTIAPVKPGPPGAGTAMAVLVNILILFSPILVRLRPSLKLR